MIHDVLRKKDEDIYTDDDEGRVSEGPRRKKDPEQRWLEAAKRGIDDSRDPDVTLYGSYDPDEDRDVSRELRSEDSAAEYAYNRWHEA